MRGLTLCLAASLAVLGTNAIDVGIEMFKEILNFPLRTNPFFAKIISLGDDFNAEGIIDGEIDSSGYVCQTLGNIKCEDEHQPLCSGKHQYSTNQVYFYRLCFHFGGIVDGLLRTGSYRLH